MFRRVTSTLLAGAAAFVFQGVALAHDITLAATAVCQGNTASINYTVTSNGYAASEIDVSFNGVQVDAGATNATFQFSGVKPAPAGTPIIVTAFAKTWVDGNPNGQTASQSVAIPADCLKDGRFTGGGKQDVVDVITGIASVNGGDSVDNKGNHVTKGFEIHCDLDHPNNLEVNWTQGHHFHTEVFSNASCSDDPNIKQQPPKSPVDTIVGKGTGRYDGVLGFTIEFTLVDAGEPGTNDKSAFKIYETANPSNVVLLVPLSFITSGNIQTHFDNK